MPTDSISIPLDRTVWRHVLDTLHLATPEASIGTGSKDEQLASYARAHAITVIEQWVKPKRTRKPSVNGQQEL
jgi:hypothetical protein